MLFLFAGKTESFIIKTPNSIYRGSVQRSLCVGSATQKLLILYAYCTAGARGGRTTGILKVSGIEKAMKILSTGPKAKTKSKPTARRSPASRK